MEPVIVQPPLGDNPPTARLYYGVDAIEGLRLLADNSAHCAVTSPPYWGLRNYQAEGQLGAEETPEFFISRLLDVFRELRRVLRPEGLLWVIIGDTWRDKSLTGIPERLALGLREQGWRWRGHLPWLKVVCVPERSLRPTAAHEHVFMFANSETYYYDRVAVKQPAKEGGLRHFRTTDPFEQLQDLGAAEEVEYLEYLASMRDQEGMLLAQDGQPLALRAKPMPTLGTHFAIFPPKLVEPLVLASTSDKGCCPHCGAPWSRRVDSYRTVDGLRVDDLGQFKSGSKVAPDQAQGIGHWRIRSVDETLGWEPSCVCPAHDPVPCTVLDPFSGSGTTGLVALAEGRDYIGIDIQKGYLAIAEARILGGRPVGDPEPNEPGDALDLFGTEE